MTIQATQALTDVVRALSVKFKFDFEDAVTFLETPKPNVNLSQPKWVVPAKMFAENALPKKYAELGKLTEASLRALPKSYFTKNSRQPSNKGQMHFGWTAFSGPQTTAVCGIQMPYQTKAFKLVKQKHTTLFKNIISLTKYMWKRACLVFPNETKTMMQVSSGFRLANTGFTKISSATNLNALWHIDSGNLNGSIQCVLVLGDFVGGNVCLDPNGRSGSMRTHQTKSLGSESEVLVIPNQHGTLFIGKYDKVWHSVKAVISGNRTIIAAYSTTQVQKFDNAAIKSGKFTYREAETLKEERKLLIKSLHTYKDLKVRAKHRRRLTDTFKLQDEQKNNKQK